MYISDRGACVDSVDNQEECARIMLEHPEAPSPDAHAADQAAIFSKNRIAPVIDVESERVKGICAFTRSVGDCQMKTREAAELWNSKHRTLRVEPLPRSAAAAPVRYAVEIPPGLPL